MVYSELQERPGQKLHLVSEANGRPLDVAICGRNNHRMGAWQRALLVEPGCICRNCLRVKRARQARKQKE